MLLKAAKTKNLQEVKHAIENGADINQSTWLGKTALFLAIAGPKGGESPLKLIQYLLDNGADPNAKTSREETTALILASMKGDVELAKILLEAGANPNHKDADGDTPLILAVNGFRKTSRLELCKLLLDHEADIASRNKQSKNAFTTLIQTSPKRIDLEIADLLVKAAAIKQTPLKSYFTKARILCQRGEVEVLNLLKINGLNLNRKDSFRVRLIEIACNNKQLETVKYLLEQGAEYNYPSRPPHHNDFLFTVCQNDWIDILEYLKQKNYPFTENKTLLKESINAAVINSRINVIAFLERNDIDLHFKLKNHPTGIMTAIEHKRRRLFTYLLKTCYNLEETDKDGNTALLIAAKFGRFEMLKSLLEKGANLQAVNKDNYNALMFKGMYENFQFVTFLLEKGINPDQISTDTGQTALFLAAQYGRQTVVRLLLKAGANPSHQDHTGKTPALIASINDHTVVVQLLESEQNHFTPHPNEDEHLKSKNT